MRCSKCGHMVGLITKFCPKCGTEVTGKQRKKGLISLGIRLLLFALIWVAVYFLFKKYYLPAQSYSHQVYIISVSIYALMIWGGIFLVYFIIFSLVRLTTRHKIWGIITIVIILGICGISVFYYLQWSNIKTLNNSLLLLQDNLTELTAAKLMGDAVVAKKTIPGTSIQKVQSSAFLVESRLEFISVPKELEDYKQSIQEWAKAVSAAANDTKTWKDLENNPRDFRLKLSDKQAEKLFKNSLERIVTLKEFGDTAIEKKDRIAMVYITARLLVQQHWLDGVIHSEKAGLFSFNLVTPALAYAKTTRTNLCGVIKERNYCTDTFVIIGNLASTTYQYATAPPVDNTTLEKMKEELQIKWEELAQVVPTESIGGDFDSKAIDFGYKEVQAFYKECEAKNGHIGGGELVKNNLPTSETGYTCEYKIKGEHDTSILCWDYLTYSGGRYMGGNKGCEEKNLIPTMDEENMEEKTAETGGKFDGDYTFPGTTIKCSGDFTLSIPTSGGTASVRNNIVYVEGLSLPIYGNSMVYTISRSQQAGDVHIITNEIDTAHFFEGGCSVTFTGTITTIREGEVKTASCFGSMNGNKVK